jgi:outer membrane protein TolC
VAAQEAFEISELQHRQGTADLLTVLQAQQTLFSAQDQPAGGGGSWKLGTAAV